MNNFNCSEYCLGTGCVTIKIPSLNKYTQLNTVFRAGNKVLKIDKFLSALEKPPGV